VFSKLELFQVIKLSVKFHELGARTISNTKVGNHKRDNKRHGIEGGQFMKNEEYNLQKIL
jgi:hypothetical protein